MEKLSTGVKNKLTSLIFQRYVSKSYFPGTPPWYQIFPSIFKTFHLATCIRPAKSEIHRRYAVWRAREEIRHASGKLSSRADRYKIPCLVLGPARKIKIFFKLPFNPGWIWVYDVFWSIALLTYFSGWPYRHCYWRSVRQRSRRSANPGTFVSSPRRSYWESRYFRITHSKSITAFRPRTIGKTPGHPRAQKRAQQVVRVSLRLSCQKRRISLYRRQNGRRNGHCLCCVWLGYSSVAKSSILRFSTVNLNCFFRLTRLSYLTPAEKCD